MPTHAHFADLTNQPLAALISLQGKRAVVTGAAQGIGQAIARRLAEAGADLLLLDQQEKVAMVAQELAATAPGRILTQLGDVRQSATLEQAADRAVQELGGLDIWVNDAGVYPPTPSLEMTDEQWQRTVETDLTGTFYGCRAAGRRMKDHGGGVIVNISSSLSFRGVPAQANYVAAKWGVRGLTAALAAEWGKAYGIRVVAVAPGLTRTPSMLSVMHELDKKTGQSAEAEFAQRLPAQRLGEPDDIARAVLFAACGLGQFLTGSTVLADGGEVYAAGATAAAD